MPRQSGLRSHADIPIHVVAGVLRDDRGRVLLTQRAADKHLGGCWEFPGGKRELNESNQTALFRELREELGIQVMRARHWLSLSYAYPTQAVRLYLFDIEVWHGQPQGLEGQPLNWFEPADMKDLAMPAADRPIVAVLGMAGA